MNLKMTRVRDTAATRLRLANIRSLVKQLAADGPMLRDDICFFLGMSPSGGRKYIRELSDVGVIIGTSEAAGVPRLYTLNPDQDHVAAMLTAMAAPHAAPAGIAGAPTTGRIVITEPGRHLHVMLDDVQYKIKSTYRIPAPDPLLAALFGRGAPA